MLYYQATLGQIFNLQSMKANSFENLISDQVFKITKADEDISDYLEDCPSPFTMREQVLQIHPKIPIRIVR